MFNDYYQFARSNYHFLFFGLLTAFFGNFGQTFFIAWFGESIQKEFALSAADYGSLYSAATLTSGLIILYAGALLDKTALRTFSLITSAGLILGCCLVYFSQQSWQLGVALFLLRFCGQGLMFHIAYTSMARYFEQNRGKAIGIVGFGMPLGEAILPAIAVMLIIQLGWRETWLVLAALIAILYWPFSVYLLAKSKKRLAQISKDQKAQAEPSSKKSWTRSQVIRDFRFWGLLPAIMAPAFIITGIFIHQGKLLQHMSWSHEWFATSFIVYAIFHLKASVISGGLVDKYSGRALILYYLVPLFIAVGLLALPVQSPLLALAFMFLAGISIGAGGPIVGSLWVEMYGNQNIGAIRSLVTSIMVFSTAISPILFGWLLDIGVSYPNLMLMLSGYLFTAWLLVVIVRVTWQKQPLKAPDNKLY